MLPSQRHSWTIWHGDETERASTCTSSRHRLNTSGAEGQRLVTKSGAAEIAASAASLEGEATLRLLADPKLYADFQARIRQHRPATNVATHELLKEFLAEKKYCDQRELQRKKKVGTKERQERNEMHSLQRTVPGRLEIFLSRNQRDLSHCGNGSVPSLEEVSEKNRMQRRQSIDIVSMASSSSASTQTTLASTCASNGSFEVSLSGLIHPTSWFS